MLITASTLYAQVERILPVRGTSSLEGTSFVVGFMQNEITEINEKPRIQIFISAQFDATVMITSPIAGTYTVTVPANTVHVETLLSDHVNTRSEVPEQKAVFLKSDVPIVVYALNTLAQSTDSYTAIPIRHLGTNYRTVNRPTDRYQGQNYYNQLPRVGEFMVIAVEDNTVVTIDTPVPTLRRQRAISVTLRKGDCYLVQALPTANGADDLTASVVRSTKPVALLSGHVRSSMPTVSANSKDHLVEQLPPIDKWGRMHATAPMALQATTKPPDRYRIVASKPDQTISCELLGRTSSWVSNTSTMWFDTAFREPAYWHSDDPFLLVQCMPSGGLNPVNFDPAMVVIPPIEQFVTSALFQFPKLEVNDAITNQQFFYFLNVIATPEALQSLRIDKTPVRSLAVELLTQVVPGTDLHWAQVQLPEGSHVIASDSGLFTAIMYGTSFADSYANMVGVAYEPQRKVDVSPPVYSMAIDCGAILGEVRDVSKDTAKLQDVYVVNAQTRNYRWTLTPMDDSAHVVLFEATVQDPLRDAQIVLHAYDDKGNGKEWKYFYDAPAIAYPKSVSFQRNNAIPTCTTVVIRNTDTSAARISSVYIVGDARFTVTPQFQDTLLPAKDSLVLKVCVAPMSDTGAINAVLRIQLPCLYRTLELRTTASGLVRGSEVDFGDVRVGDTVCAPLTIVNTGTTAVLLTYAMLQQQSGGLTLDTIGLMLPRMLPPGGSVVVKACFAPADTGRVIRTDTVRTNNVSVALLTSQGRGVAPQIASMLIDWGRRRVGGRYDTTVYVRNLGTGSAKLDAGLSALQPPFRSMSPDLVRWAVNAADSVPVTIRYAPLTRGFAQDSAAVRVDWRFHGPVWIRLQGIGVLPQIELHDIDMGSVDIGTSRDSLAQLLAVGALSNAPLVVDSIRVLGPDVAAFSLPASFRGLVDTNVFSAIMDSVRFSPKRTGAHVCAIEVTHNGGVELPVRDTFRLYGNGLEPPRPAIELQLGGALRPLVCSNDSIYLRIINSGTATAILRDVHLIIGSDTIAIVAPPRDLILPPDSMFTYLHAYQVMFVGPTPVMLVAADSAGTRYVSTITVIPHYSIADISHGWDSLPSGNRLELLTGYHTLLIRASVSDTIEFHEAPTFTVNIPRVRFACDPRMVRMYWVKENGRELSRDIAVEIKQTQSAMVVSCNDVPKAPWECIVSMGGQILWKDDSTIANTVRLESAPCLQETASQPIEITTVPCGAHLRQVALGQLPVVSVKPLQQPSDDMVSLEVTSSIETSISIAVQTLSGQEFHIDERFTLQKGVQHCNFSCSDWVPGLYRLVVYQGADIVDRKIIIVN